MFIGFISFVFVYIVGLLRLLDTPFRAPGTGLDDISTFQMDAMHDELHEKLDSQSLERHH